MQVYRSDLQILRGFSVVLVVFYHLKVMGFSNGYLGVDVFFVLSGYLMSIISQKVTIIQFYDRRLRRLLPAYLVTILVTTALVVMISSPIDANQRLSRVWFDLLGLSNIAFWFENSYFESDAFKPLLNLWSLGVELQFYLIAPFLLPFLRKRRILLFLLISLSIATSIIVLTVSPKTSFFMMPTRLWEFLMGAFVGWCSIKVISRKKRMFFAYGSLFTIILVVLFYPLKNDAFSFAAGHPGFATLIVAVATAVIIATGTDEIFHANKFLGRVFASLGNYSYSIYLTHFPIIVLYNYSAFGGTRLGINTAKELFIVIFLTSAASYLMFNFVEIKRYSKKFFLWVLIIFSVIILVALGGKTLNQYNFSDEQNLIFNAWQDRTTYRCGKVFRIKSPNETICRLGSVDNDKRVLLLGNSHADSIKKAFTNSASESKISTYFYVANNPLMSSQTSAINIANDVERKNIESVVIHYSPGFYSEKKYLQRLEEFVTLMSQKNVTTHFVAPVPVYERHIPKAMISHIEDSDRELPSQRIENYMKLNKNYFDFIEQNQIDNARVFLPHKILCSNGQCLFAENGIPYYFDSMHLTLTGARRLSAMFDEVAQALLD